MSFDRERVETLSALCAAGGASPDEERELALLSASFPEAARIAREFRDAAAAMALSLPPELPPTGALLRIRTLIAQGSAIDGPPTVQDGAPPQNVIALFDRRRKRTVLLAAVAVSVTAAAAAVLGVLYVREHERAGELTAQVDAVEKRLADYQARYAPVRSADLRLATMHSEQGGVANVLFVPSEHRCLVLAHSLPTVPDKDYQLWFVPPDGGAPISAGLLEVGPDGVLGAEPTIPAQLGQLRPAISLEPKGGSKKPTDIKMVGDLI